MPTLPKIFRPVTRNILIFLFGLTIVMSTFYRSWGPVGAVVLSTYNMPCPGEMRVSLLFLCISILFTKSDSTELTDEFRMGYAPYHRHQA